MTAPEQPLRALLRRRLASFVERSFREVNPGRPYLSNGHILAMCSMLERVMAGEVKRLIINLPPRSLKSHTTSVAFVAWMLGHHPEWQIICASYGQELADKLGRDTRSIMQSEFYKKTFATRLGERTAVHDFETTALGGRMATSVGGVMTGRGAEGMIVDDAMKAEDALSSARRAEVIEWLEHTAISRLNQKEDGFIVVVAQRLHESDLCGHLIEQGGWEVLSFAAIAEEDEIFEVGGLFGEKPFRRLQGQALHPARESLDTLQRIKASIGDYHFQAQYQQQPVPRDGTVVKRAWLRHYEPEELPDRFELKVLSWDTASKTGERNDYSVCTIWGVNANRMYLLDVIRERFEFPQLEQVAIRTASAHPGATTLIEDCSSGAQLIQNLQYARLPGVVAHRHSSGQDKFVRLHAQASLFQDGTVRLPKTAPWLGAYESEILSFPGGRHDDQVDSTTQALAHMREALYTDEIPDLNLDMSFGRRENPWHVR